MAEYHQYNNKITNFTIARVHVVYPSTTREWDVEMIDNCRRPIVALIARKLVKRDERRRPPKDDPCP